jgi:diacylglycerol kinase (ATP)
VLRLLKATLNSWNGLRAAARSEQAFREEIVALLMIVELLNTAVEKLSDHVTPYHHDAIGRIKDMASAAVGLSLLLCGLVWLVALAERFGLL